MQVNSTPSTSGGAGQTGAAQARTPQQDFLQLLLVQMGNQDPSAPMDPKDMVAQLATLAQVESMANMGAQLDAMLVAQAASNQLSAANLVGRTVTYRSDSLELSADSQRPVMLHANVGAGAQQLTVTVKDANGQVVRTLRVDGPFKQGIQDVAWDGLNDAGEAVADGAYKVEVVASDSTGAAVDAAAMAQGAVESVQYTAGYPVLQVNGTELPLSEVTRVGA